MDKVPAAAGEAARKFRLAYGLNTSVYIYGATGYGKTALVRSLLPEEGVSWYSCQTSPDEIIVCLESSVPGQRIVIDDLQALDDEAVKNAIRGRLEKNDCWLTLIGRMQPPDWLLPLILKTRLIVISEEDLRLTPQTVREMAEPLGLALSDEDVTYLLDYSEGNAMIAGFALQKAAEGGNLGPGLMDQIRGIFKDYLYSSLISQWNSVIRDFLLQLSVVDAFDLTLAEEITGDDQSIVLLKAAANLGNILTCADGFWTIRPILRETLREHAAEVLGRRRFEHCQYNAARYYELHDDFARALQLYEVCGERDSIRALLVRNARRHPGTGCYYELRRYYLELPEEEVLASPLLMFALGLLNSVLMNREKSEYWYESLRDYTTRVRGTERKEAESQLIRLEFNMPHRGSGNILQMLKAASFVMRSTGAGLQPLSMTNNQPSLMNGSLDFCEWSKKDSFLAETFGGMVEKVLGSSGVGLVHTAMGESLFEKCADTYQVIGHLTKAQSESETRGIIEMTFVAVALQAKLAAYTGDVEHAEQLLRGIEQRSHSEKARQLYPSIRAFRCQLDLLKNDLPAVKTWLADSPDEIAAFCTLNRYFYVTKIRCYLTLGRPMAALALIERMLDYAEYAKRTYIRMECGLLRAIAQKRCGMEWQQGLLDTLQEIFEYRFIRIAAHMGAALVPLLEELRKNSPIEDAEKKAWFEKLLQEALLVSRRYPNYLRGSGVDLSEFSETALAVLRLQASGYSTREIADQLFISQSTVKYHSKENYRKLGARDMVEAVGIARDMHIL